MNAERDIAILWDVENVTPTVNSLFVDGLMGHAAQMGRITLSKAYGDWNKKAVKGLSHLLSERSFDLVHVPSTRKNSNAAALITNAIEIVFQYPRIEQFIVMSGNADFRPLLTALRKHGKEVFLICDAGSASEELLALADDFIDFRELLPWDKDNDTSEDDDATKQDVDLGFELLVEAVKDMEAQKKKTGLAAVRVRVKLLNRSFAEANYGFASWGDFINAAIENNYVSLDDETKGTFLKPVEIEGEPSRARLSTAFDLLVETMKKMNKNGGDEFHTYQAVNNRLLLEGIDVTAIGFRRFRHFVQAAAVKGLVETKDEKLEYYLKLK